MSRENEMSEEADEGELGMHRMAEQGWVRVEASDRVSLVIHPAAPQPEPVAEVIDREHQPWEHGKHTSWLVNPSDLPAGTKLYAAAPPAAPAPAVPLTDEQFADIVAEASLAVDLAANPLKLLAFARAVLSAAPVVREPLTFEQRRAIQEAHCNDMAQAYFSARPQLNDKVERRIYEAGFNAGYGIGGGGK